MLKKLQLFIFVISIIFSSSSYANTFQELYDNGLKAIKEGGNIIFLRHAYAPRTVENGNHDKNYKDKVCSTQRDILKEGIRQSKDIGNFVTKNNIKIDKVISSPACRTYKTAKYAGWDYSINKNLKNTRKKKRSGKKI